MTQRESLRQGKGGNKPVTEKDNEGETVSQLVRTGGWARSVGSGQFVQEPVRWCAQALLVLLSVVLLVILFFSSINTMESSIYIRSTSHFDVFVDVGVGLVEKSSVSPGRWREGKSCR